MPTILYKNKAGKRIPGVTTIKNQIGWGKEGLLNWANTVGLDGLTLDEARDTATIPGTIAHYLIECHLKGIKPSFEDYKQEDIDKAETAYLNFLEWERQFQFEPIAVEPHLVSETYQFGGTPDVIGIALNHEVLLDWKSGKVYEDLFLQLAAYKELAEENFFGPIEGFHVLRIAKDADIPPFKHLYWGRLPDAAWDAFICTKRLKEYQAILKTLL